MELTEVLKLKRRFEAECEKFLEQILGIQKELCKICTVKVRCPLKQTMQKISIKDVGLEEIVGTTLTSAGLIYTEILQFEGECKRWK